MTLVVTRFHLSHAPICDALVLGHALLVVEGSIDELVNVACNQALAFNYER